MVAPVVVDDTIGVDPSGMVPGAGLLNDGVATFSVYCCEETLLAVEPAAQAIACSVAVPVEGFVTLPLIATCETELYWSELPVQAPLELHVGVVTPSSV
jgi:hypothetical protein